MPLTTTFVGVDADAIGNGDPDETQVIDTWLQRRIQINNENLLAPKHGICWSPILGASGGTFTSYVGIRPSGAFEWYSRWTGYIWAYKDQTGFDLTLAYQADTPGSATQAGVVSTRVRCSDGTVTTEASLASTYSSGIKTGHQTISVTFAERVSHPRLMRVSIQFRHTATSTVATTIGDSADGTTANVKHRYPYVLFDTDGTGDGYFYPNSSGSSPDGDSLEAMYIYGGTHPGWPDANGARYDLIYTADQSNTGTIGGTLRAVVASAPDTAADATAYMHTCLMLRAMFIEPTFDSTPPTAWQPPAKYAPNQEFGSAEAMFQAAEVIRAYRQPSIALIGPRGRLGDAAFTEKDLHEFAGNGYPVHWPTILGDFNDSTSGQHTDLINEGFYLRTENPRLELVCQWVSAQHGAPFDQNQTATDSQKHRPGEGSFDKVDVTTTSGPGAARWDLTASVHQLADAASGTGDWATDITEYGSLAESVTVPVYGADVIGGPESQPPILRGMDSMEQTGKGTASSEGFWFKEGSLFDDDLPLLYETRHNITLSNLTQTEVLKPLRLKLNMDLDDFYDPVKVGSNTATLESQLRLTLVSFTLIEHPEDP